MIKSHKAVMSWLYWDSTSQEHKLEDPFLNLDVTFTIGESETTPKLYIQQLLTKLKPTKYIWETWSEWKKLHLHTVGDQEMYDYSMVNESGHMSVETEIFQIFKDGDSNFHEWLN